MQAEPRTWTLRYHYACDCGWIQRQSDFVKEPETCPECGAPPGKGPGSAPKADVSLLEDAEIAIRTSEGIARLKGKANRMREVIGNMESAMYGCDELIDLKETWEDDGVAMAEGHKVRDDLDLLPRLRWGDLKRIFAALDELNAIVNDDKFSPRHFT